jgi:predicted aldo/keto reductase-like oxidoreductase
MKEVRLGRTNLVVKKLGWGSIPIRRVSEEQAVGVVQAVLEMGVNLLDTARAYTHSERRIGLALQKVPRPVILSSKSTERTNKIYEQVQESLKQLQVSKIHIYHLHNPSKVEEYEKAMAPGGAYEGLLRAKAEGLIDHIGITNHNLDILERALKDGRFDVVMACYSFLEPEAAKRIFPLAQENDVGIMSMKPLSGGVIEKAGPALRFVLQTPHVAVIPGSEKIELAKENWRIATAGSGLTPEDQAYIQQVQREMEQQFCRRCDYCQPCSENINIQAVLGLKSIIKRVGANEDEMKRINKILEMARNCSECGECMSRCPYQLPIPELIKKNLNWYEAQCKN